MTTEHAEITEHGGRVRRPPWRPRWEQVAGLVAIALSVPLLVRLVLLDGGTGHGEHAAPVVTEVRAASGLPVVARVRHASATATVLVSPARPGWNLVQVLGRHGHDASGQAGSGPVRIGTEDSGLVPAGARPGATGLWARVRLPSGESSVRVALGGGPEAWIAVDTGSARPEPAAAPAAGAVSGVDGPECTAAATGALIAGKALRTCPSERLTEGDADRLRGLVRFLAGRRLPGLAVIADGTPRARAATEVLRDAANEHDLGLSTDPARAPREHALLTVAGWETAARELGRLGDRQRRGEVAFTGGTYLAPWLLNGALLDAVPNALLPLGFDVRRAETVRFAAALRVLLPGERPTAAAYEAWRSANATETRDRLYATSRVNVMPGGSHRHEERAGWFPGGTITPVTTALPTH